MSNYCNRSWKEVVDKLSSDIYKGLTEEECNNRRKTIGDNKVVLPESSGISLLIKSFIKVYFIVLIFIVCFSFYNKSYLLSLISSIMLLTNIVIKISFFLLNKKNISYLQKVNKSTVTVLRESKEKIIKSEELVKGDIVLFKKSSLIGADIRIINAKNLKVDEKNITGENFLKEKFESRIDKTVEDLPEMKNVLFKGSVVREGSGIGIVIETGSATAFGKLMAMLSYANKNRREVSNFLEKRLSIFSLIMTVMSFIIWYIGNREINNLITSLTLLSSLPVGIITVIYLYIFKKDLNKNENIEIINISILQYLKDIEFVFLDKIGSLTKNELIVRGIYTNDTIYNEEEINYNSDTNIKRLIDTSLLCNNALYNVRDDSGSGNIFEIAFLRFAAKHKIYKSIIDGKYKRIFEIVMDHDKRILTTLNKCNKGYRANIRGNVDVVLSRCTHIMIDGTERELTESYIEKIKAIDYNYSVEGLLSQGLAYRSFSYEPSPSENIESNLVFIGMVALENPLCEDIKNDLYEIKRRNITPIIFTEDNRIAAFAAGKKLKLIRDISEVISGVEMSSLNRDEFIKVLEKVKVFARITPEIKGKIVGMFTRDKYEIAVAGENLSDLPSLSISKIGISKGEATEVVKKVSDVYIKENYLSGFIKLFDIAKRIKIGLNKEIKFIITIILSQIALINFLPMLKIKANISEIIILNILLIPLSLILLNGNYKNNTEGDIKRYIFRGAIWTGVPLIVLHSLKSGHAVMALIIIGLFMIQHVIIESRVSIKSVSKELIILMLSILLLIIIITCFVMMDSITFKSEEIIKVAIIILVNFFLELLIRNWE